MKQDEAWQGSSLPEEVWLAPARIHRKDVVAVKGLTVFLLVSVLVLMALLTYSLCVMAKDEDDAEQADWIQDLNSRDEDSGEK